MNIESAIAFLEKHIQDARIGLPDDIFYFVSRVTPMINIDLLIKDERGRSLLSWRNDPYAGTGWHIPGGIIRHKEPILNRVRKVAETEIKTQVDFDPEPIAINEIIAPHKNRAHFISLLFVGRLDSKFQPNNGNLKPNEPGFLAWHNDCPNDLLKFHEIYRKYITANHKDH